MKLRNFSPKTIQSYLYYITQILEVANKGARDISGEDIRNYLASLGNPLDTLQALLVFGFGDKIQLYLIFLLIL